MGVTKIAEKDSRRWHKGFELRLVPGPHECDKQLTDMILEILRDEFKLTGAQVIPSYPENPKDESYNPRSKKSLVIGFFPEKEEVRIDMGEQVFSELVNREAVFFVTHPYNKNAGVQCESTLKLMRLFGDTLRRNGARIKQLGIVTPVAPYELNHSVNRRRREGLIEGRGLEMFLEDLARAGYNEFTTIMPHSDTTRYLTKIQGMNFRGVNVFRGEWEVKTPRMGPFLYKNPSNTEMREDYQTQLARLMPFVSLLRERYEGRFDQLVPVATDDGVEDDIGYLDFALIGNKQRILAINKERTGPGKAKIVGVKSWSTIDLDDIAGKVCIIIDDRRLSGGTLQGVAYALKHDHHAKEVVALVAHDLGYDDSITRHSDIDRYIFLETNPGSAVAALNYERVERIPMRTTALLLAAEIFDSYVNLRDRGQLKVRE
jgi:phosphoribosylpyrophosphate synthetase